MPVYCVEQIPVSLLLLLRRRAMSLCKKAHRCLEEEMIQFGQKRSDEDSCHSVLRFTTVDY